MFKYLKTILTSKGWPLFMVVTLSLGLAGGGYAAWTTSLHVEGIVQTGSIEAVWDMQEEREFVEVFNSANGELEIVEPIPADKDVADCFSDLEERGGTAQVVNFKVTNAFPSYTCEIIMGALIQGTIPIHISKIQTMATDQLGIDVLGTELDIDVRLTMKVEDVNSDTGFRCDDDQPIGVSTQLHPDDRFCAIIRIHANQEAQQNHIYRGAVWIELIQWNLAGVNVEDEVRAQVAEVLGGDVIRFQLVQVSFDVAELAGLPLSQASLIPVPFVNQDGVLSNVQLNARRVQLRDPKLILGGQKGLTGPAGGTVELVALQLRAEQSFDIGECSTQPIPEQTPNQNTGNNFNGFATQNNASNANICGALSIISEDHRAISGVLVGPDGMSFFEPVDQLLGSDNHPGLLVAYNVGDTTDTIFGAEEEPDTNGQSDVSLRDAVARKVAGFASPLLTHNPALKRANIVLDGDAQFYAINPSDWPQRQMAVFNVTRFIYGFIEPLTIQFFGGATWGLNLKVKGQEVWTSGGPTATTGTALINEIEDPSYFLINPVTDNEIHYLYYGRDVLNLLGKAGGIGNPAGGGFGAGSGNNHAFGEARSGQSLKTRWIVQAHEVGHLIGGTHGNGQVSGCAQVFWIFGIINICGASIMPSGGAASIAARAPYFSPNNDIRIKDVLNNLSPALGPF